MSEATDVYKVLEVMSERVTDLHKSYRTLNDDYTQLAIEITKIDTKIGMMVDILKFFISPPIAILIIAELLRLAGVT